MKTVRNIKKNIKVRYACDNRIIFEMDHSKKTAFISDKK